MKKYLLAFLLLAGCTSNPLMSDNQANHLTLFKICGVEATRAYPPKFSTKKKDRAIVCKFTDSIRCSDQNKDFDDNDEPRQRYLAECFKLKLEDA